eukprot:TRINITY_DN3159_c1_g1_i4.p1 TRINITY_DN3159_c1_g1~~TRINITY_DN3159_c1_g1_i4.p1  ORF type:complete len:232 (-),score=-20.15 TRINITY_DN3159_c1_g1_i4:244-888(-)
MLWRLQKESTHTKYILKHPNTNMSSYYNKYNQISCTNPSFLWYQFVGHSCNKMILIQLVISQSDHEQRHSKSSLKAYGAKLPSQLCLFQRNHYHNYYQCQSNLSTKLSFAVNYVGTSIALPSRQLQRIQQGCSFLLFIVDLSLQLSYLLFQLTSVRGLGRGNPSIVAFTLFVGRSWITKTGSKVSLLSNVITRNYRYFWHNFTIASNLLLFFDN